MSRLSVLNSMRLYNNLENFEESFRPKLQSIMKALEEVYPSLWDIHFSITEDFKGLEGEVLQFKNFYIIIKFPKITIKNSLNLTHEIEELFVKIHIKILTSGSLKIFPEIQGVRTLVTKQEWDSNYSHSHLSTDNSSIGTYTVFCTGSGEINNLGMLFNSKPTDFDIFKMYLLHLETFTSWESLEGTPYRYIKNIASQDSYLQNYSDSMWDIHYRAFYIYLKENNIRLEWFINGDNRPEPIIPEEVGINFIKIHLKKIPSYYTVVKSSSGKLVSISTSEMPVIPERSILFQGEQIKLKITNVVEVKTPTLYLHPHFINYVIRKFKKIAQSKTA